MVPNRSFHAMGRISAPAPVSTSIPHRMDLSPSKGLVTSVCTMIRPIGNPSIQRCMNPCIHRIPEMSWPSSGGES